MLKDVDQFERLHKFFVVKCRGIVKVGELMLNFRLSQISFLFFFFLFWDLRDTAFGACSPEMIIWGCSF